MLDQFQQGILVPVQRHRIRGGLGRDRVLCPLNNADGSKHQPGGDHAHDHLLAVVGELGELDAPAEENIHAFGRVVLVEEKTFLHIGLLNSRGEDFLQRVLRQALEQADPG